MINPLPTTWEVALCVRGALEITRRMLERSPCHQQTKCQAAFDQFPACQATLAKIQTELRQGTLYEGSEEVALRWLTTERGKQSEPVKEVESLLVLALWATFERFLRDYLRDKGTVLKQQTFPFAHSLYEHFENSVEWWKPSDILRFLKYSPFPNSTLGVLLDRAGQILEHRNYVAHANPKKRTTRCDLEVVYNTLNEIIEILLQY